MSFLCVLALQFRDEGHLGVRDHLVHRRRRRRAPGRALGRLLTYWRPHRGRPRRTVEGRVVGVGGLVEIVVLELVVAVRARVVGLVVADRAHVAGLIAGDRARVARGARLRAARRRRVAGRARPRAARRRAEAARRAHAGRRAHTGRRGGAVGRRRKRGDELARRRPQRSAVAEHAAKGAEGGGCVRVHFRALRGRRGHPRAQRLEALGRALVVELLPELRGERGYDARGEKRLDAEAAVGKALLQQTEFAEPARRAAEWLAVLVYDGYFVPSGVVGARPSLVVVHNDGPRVVVEIVHGAAARGSRP
mmetsp:Transcript_29213/g.100855  ORF Transcript_29213/g.100855 Transcript_29213/m.100855 type:complete len:307 (+) Transcript_29213:378-1298(+)